MSGAREPSLVRFVRPRPEPDPATERCDLCGTDLGDPHDHLVDLDLRSLLCACRACALLFTNPGAGAGRYRPIPDRRRTRPDFRLTPVEWEELQIPVSVAFFFLNSSLGRWAAFYPSPAGATESVLSLDAWSGVLDGNPGLADLEPDVEAVLVRRVDDRFECHVVPISDCYELVGLMRLRWRGFDGGQPVREAIDAFFAGLAGRSAP